MKSRMIVIMSFILVILFTLFVKYFKLYENFSSYSDLYRARGYDNILNNTSISYGSGSGLGYNPEIDYNATEIESGSGFHYNTAFDSSSDGGFIDTEHQNLIGSGDVLYAYDNNENLVQVPYKNVKGLMSYYEPGNYQFDTSKSSYKASNEKTVFSSILTGETEHTNVTGTPSQMGGICNNYKKNPALLEQSCNSLDNSVCASTSCCVLLGGSKCVSGDETGPVMRSNYADTFLRNKDYYYYNGQCYGNCVKDPYVQDKTANNKARSPAESVNVNIPSKIDLNINLDVNNKNAGSSINNDNINSGNKPSSGSSSNDLSYGYIYDKYPPAGSSVITSYDQKNDWASIGSSWQPVYNNFFDTYQKQDHSNLQIYTPEYSYNDIMSAIGELNKNQPNVANAIAYISTALSVHKNNINNINPALFNLNIALTNMSGQTKMSVETAFTSLNSSLQLWPNNNVVAAWHELNGSSTDMQKAVNDINVAIAKEKDDKKIEDSIISSLNIALNAINKVTPDISTSLQNLNSAISVLKQWQNIGSGSSRFSNS